MPWAARNIFVVNPEWYVESWNAYLPKFDRVWCKDPVSTELFGRLTGAKIECMPWAVALEPLTPVASGRSFLWMLGASKNKRAYVPTLLKYWKESYPPLRITTTEPLSVDVTALRNVTVLVKDLSKEERSKLQAENLGHVVCSRAEGFGNVAAAASAREAAVTTAGAAWAAARAAVRAAVRVAAARTEEVRAAAARAAAVTTAGAAWMAARSAARSAAARV
jgi:hypothetical protein